MAKPRWWIKMLMAGNLFRENQSTGELILDNNDLERERESRSSPRMFLSITKDTKINIIDTPDTLTSAVRWSVC